MLAYLAAGFLILLLLVYILLAVTADTLEERSPEELQFKDATTGEKIDFPSVFEDPSLQLSVVVPAYNEETRLIPMLDECIEFLENKSKKNYTYEIIVVSDGSRDNTVKVAMNYSKKYSSNKIRVLDLVKNRGKGGAVKFGVESSRGALILFADADGATKFKDITKLEESIEELAKCKGDRDLLPLSKFPAIGIGSRAHLEEDSIASRSMFRTFLMYGFHFLVWFFAVRGIKDTQCGFKLFTRQAARMCFSNMHVPRWAFDVEILYIAQTLKIPITEHAVNWTEIDGSKVTPVWSWIQMGRDLGLIWLRYLLGAWKIRKQW